MGVQKSKKSKKFTKYSKNAVQFRNQIKFLCRSAKLRDFTLLKRDISIAKSIKLL